MNLFNLTISTLSSQGEGIARVEGKATFVPFTLPGETWSVDLVDTRKNYDRALPIELIQSAADTPPRSTPLCPCFGACGGCQLQHILYADQLDWKRRWLQETSGVSVIWWIQILRTPASAALATHAAVSSLGSSRTAASTGPGSAAKSG